MSPAHVPPVPSQRPVPAPPGHAGRQPARLAAAFLQANSDHRLSTGDVAAACRVSVRTLYRSFVREYGTTPLQFLRDSRLERIRAELLAAAPGATVTDTAFKWGITHLGRFSHEYARRFGEPPSATLRRATGRWAQSASGRDQVASAVPRGLPTDCTPSA